MVEVAGEQAPPRPTLPAWPLFDVYGDSGDCSLDRVRWRQGAKVKMNESDDERKRRRRHCAETAGH
jgi:hypothetical protein